ncbi:MAG: arylesterase [Burkholderiales bacterium]|nr:arylesterase [Burkholderiales bacterium]MDQ3195284.1 arylesterase [Pseudomonadota bacterium]
MESIFKRVLIVILLALVPLGSARLGVAASSSAPTILVFGDSLSAGYGIGLERSWVNLLQQRLQREGYDYRVANASISGETTLGGKNRIAAALRTHSPQIVIVELGANDGLRGSSIKSMRSNLAAIIDQAKKTGARVLLVGIKLPPNYGMDYTRKFQDVYTALARENKIALAPFMFEGFAEQSEFFLADSVHPNERAQATILDNIWTPLAPLLKAAPGHAGHAYN